MTATVFEALWKLALPVALLSFVLVAWALKRGLVLEKRQMKASASEAQGLAGEKAGKDQNTDMFHKQWMRFGGGWYGTVALYTYLLVEINDVSDFIASFGSVGEFIRSINLAMLINMLVEAIMNFVTAISWPAYWIRQIETGNIGLWIGLTWVGYWLGMKAAQRRFAKDSPDPPVATGKDDS